MLPNMSTFRPAEYVVLPQFLSRFPVISSVAAMYTSGMLVRSGRLLGEGRGCLFSSCMARRPSGKCEPEVDITELRYTQETAVVVQSCVNMKAS
jgi:hypothetical protein